MNAMTELTDKRIHKRTRMNDLLMELRELENIRRQLWRLQQVKAAKSERVTNLRREIESLDREIAFELHKQAAATTTATTTTKPVSTFETLVKDIMRRGYSREDAEKAARILQAGEKG